MKQILLTSGNHALVSDEDFERLSKWRWHERTGTYGSYAVRRLGSKTIYMHREVVVPPEGLQVDHINGDGLDNRRENLRAANASQNMTNYRRRNMHGLRGIYFRRERNQWESTVQCGASRRRGQRRKCAIHAAFDYDLMALKVYGEFAVLNFPCLAKARGDQ